MAYFDDNWLSILRNSMIERGRSLPDVQLQFADAQGDVGRQLSQIQNFIAQGASVIVVNTVDSAATPKMTRLAREAGVRRLVLTHLSARYADDARVLEREARDVFEARRLIEPGIVERVIAHPERRAIVARLRQFVAAEGKARAAGDTRSIVRLSGEFHMLLAELAGNAVLAGTMRELATRTCLAIALYDKPSVPSCLADEHVELSELLLHALDHGRGCSGVGEIGRDDVCVAQRRLGFFQVCLRARDERDPGTFGEEGLGAREADALAAAGDEDVLALEPEIHATSRSAWTARRPSASPWRLSPRRWYSGC